MRTLIIYATEEGQTAKIATHIANRLSAKGFPADRHNIAVEPDKVIALDAYDAVIIGSPMHFSHYDRRLADYIRQFREELSEIPSAFFSVSLGILSDDESEQDEVRKITEAYLDATQWKPSIKTHFAGAIRYSRYGWWKRHIMQWTVRRAGGPTDAHFDYEFTDWGKVDEFVDRYVKFVKSCEQPIERSSPSPGFESPHRRFSVKHQPTPSV